MNRQTRDFNLKLNDVGGDGIIEGYASVFDVVDSYKDVIAPGAFKRTLAAWKASGRKLPVLWQHDEYNPIGVTLDAMEDETGLAVRAQLITEVQQARDAHALAKAGALGGMSIGFSIPNKASDGNAATVWDEERQVQIIREVRLWEYSLVTFPANEAATIDNVKAAANALEAATATFAAHYSDTIKLLREMRTLLETAQRPDRTSRDTDAALTDVLSEARQLLALTKGKQS
jgi:HK97 family phage prohead protease